MKADSFSSFPSNISLPYTKEALFFDSNTYYSLVDFQTACKIMSQPTILA